MKTIIGERNESLENASFQFARILTIPTNVSIIESEAFCGLKYIDGVIIPPSINSIAADAFDSGMLLFVPDENWIQWANDHGYKAVVY